MLTTPHITKRAVATALVTTALSIGLAGSAAASQPVAPKPAAPLADSATPPPDRPAKRGKGRKPKRQKATVNKAGLVIIGGQDIAWREFRGCTGAIAANWGYYRYCVWDAMPGFGPAIRREWHYQYWYAGQYREWFTWGCDSVRCYEI